MSQLILADAGIPEIGTNAAEGMDLLARREQADKEQELLSSMSLGFQHKCDPD